ncbi:type II CRISPR-associated endonuclease Cas1 [Elizabethkingia meningoseptica]|uniref:type II CRISPR-associated endonuclease Cas1 n=1 Tax=Elizabethkingia meningoseptica TaxID=238 RepID=UPI000332CF10|nr:type II CRISPR-associated endonuclease Cas1 [Elizabethkingia meningoseptica]AQX06193.1 subtype II CRISPR-associated endonuclease Cas1 [Elizabethkingia meningoseptica]AQX48241.1 type II CRISPR-associated endonuclease Cas1 [Elizabethkingia meningoseptica]EOR28890.1 CRISPR-associated protein Cas1 [Elizabethkingia meningoseptica ATCC 13253 = NBRC 12535]KUY16325.1 type II CRISPR-associated endonuclease Cas1 [Elizabethkingia meningoseptica]OPB68078.1 subtype II CRISPR-associated endonuclease Cas1
MITRSIYIGNPAYLKLKDEQMYILEPATNELKAKVPVEDLGLLMLDHFQITLSHQLIQKMMGNNVVVISCDTQHLPHGIMLPLYGHTEHSDRVKDQLNASEPLKKQLWKQTVEFKIQNQIRVLEKYSAYAEPMYEYLGNVKSGDMTNMEGIAAQHYWKYLISPDFLRGRFGDVPNPFFNFGYTVLRSIVARAIVETGLLPVLGIFHKNKYNPYCLADDLMEPYRPYVDGLVMSYIKNNPDAEELTKEAKAHLLKIATQDVKIDKLTRPLMVAVKMTVISLYKCYTGEKRLISYPELV